MAVARGLTRQEIRVAVGRNLMGSSFYLGSATSDGTVTTIIDTNLFGGDDTKNGSYIIGTGGAIDGEETRASDFVSSTSTLTFRPAMTDNASGATYELWEEDYRPADIHEYINQAIDRLVGRVYDPEEDETLHLYNDKYIYTVPSQFAMVNRLERRYSVSSQILQDCDSLWGTTDAEVTESLDTQIRRQGNSSYRMAIGVNAAAGDDLATFTIDSIDISKYDRIEFWTRSNVAVAAGELSLLLTDAGGTEETLALLAISADAWTFNSIAVTSQESNTAITGGLLDLTTDYPAGNAVVLWIDDVRAVRSGEDQWARIAPHQWRVDKLNGTIRFNSPPDYGRLRISGGDKPAQLTTDAGVCEVPEDYVIAFATWRALLGADDGSQVYRDRVNYWGSQVVLARRAMPVNTDVRTVN